MKSIKKLPAEERRAVTVASVISLAGLQNPTEITTAEIAKHMNMTQGALFRHFPNKVAIWESVMQWVAEQMLARIEHSIQPGVTALCSLETLFMTHLEFVVQHPGVPRMLFGELQRSEATPAKHVVQTLLKRYSERLQTLLETGKANGELAATLNTKAAATLFLGTIQGLIMQSLLTGRVEQLLDDAPEVFVIYRNGLRGSS